jgi:peptide/nickel transport system permease protein
MKSYIAKRLLYALLILFLVSILIFIIARLLPGDPIQAAAMMNMDLADEEIMNDLRAQFGLDRPAHLQYFYWIRDFFIGKWGVSFGSGEPVFDMFLRRIPVTLELFAGYVFWSFLIGFPLGVVSAFKRNTLLDASITSAAITGISVPVIWEAIVLIYLFAVYFQIFPPSGYVPFSENPVENILCMVMPTFVLGTHTAGMYMRYVRSSLLEVMGQDYIRTARAKGLGEMAVIMRHAAKPAMIPVVTVIGIDFAYVISGTFLVEYMFALPGFGRMGIDAIAARDYPVIQATLLVVALFILMVNLVVDLLYGYLDPRVRLA